MVQVVQAPCPGCRRILRIPAEWAHQPMRCKHCGLVLHAAPRPAAPAYAAAGAAPLSAPPTEPPFAAPPAPGPTGNGVHAGATDFSFGTDEFAGPTLRARRRRQGGGWKKAAVVVVCVLALVGTGIYFWPELRDRLGGGSTPEGGGTSGDGTGTEAVATTRPVVPPKDVPADAPFPRRALVVGVSNYVYANPVSYFLGVRGDEHHPLERVGALLRIHPDQLVELSDAAKGGRAVPPLKAVIEQTVREFLDGCRAQDRILVAFIGHAVEIDDEPYLVPLEGELTVKESLLPLAWLLEQLGKCKARQKVLILDVCRFDPGRGLERPGSGPLGAKLAAAVENPPEGVQVWAACAEGQQSLEGESGGVFFQGVEKMLKPMMSKRIQKPDEPLPVDTLAALVKDEVELTAKQSPRLTGKEPATGTAYDPAEKMPPKLAARLPLAEADVASRAAVQSILDELDLPPVRPPRAQTPPLKLETLVPFSAKVLEEYKADSGSLKDVRENTDKYPLRAAVLETADALRKHAGAPLHDYIGAGSAGEAAKKSILEHQREPALIFLDLKTKVERLREVGENRAEESKRWQAHHDYVLSQALARMAYVHEYNLMQGKIRKDDLPPLEKFHVGYRLASRERLQSDKEIRDLAAESKKLLQQIVKKYPGTPWEILAKRERFTALGMEWQPARQ